MNVNVNLKCKSMYRVVPSIPFIGYYEWNSVLARVPYYIYNMNLLEWLLLLKHDYTLLLQVTLKNISNSHSHSHFCLSFYPPANPHSKLLCARCPRTAWRRTASHVPTQMAIRRDVAPTASGRSWKGKTCHIMLTDLTFNLMAIKLMAV